MANSVEVEEIDLLAGAVSEGPMILRTAVLQITDVNGKVLSFELDGILVKDLLTDAERLGFRLADMPAIPPS